MPQCQHPGCDHCRRGRIHEFKNRYKWPLSERQELWDHTERRFTNRLQVITDSWVLTPTDDFWKKLHVNDMPAEVRSLNGQIHLRVNGVDEGYFPMGKYASGWWSARRIVYLITHHADVMKMRRAAKEAAEQAARDAESRRAQRAFEEEQQKIRNEMDREATQRRVDAIVAKYPKYLFGPRIQAKACGGDLVDFSFELGAISTDHVDALMKFFYDHDLLKKTR